MALWKVVITKSLNGRSDRDVWKNEYAFASNVALTDPGMLNIVNFLVDAERDAHYDTVFFNQAYVKQIAENAINGPADQFRTIALSGTGNRNTENGVLADSRIVPLETCMVIKRDTLYGRGGRIFLRGTMVESDIYLTENNFYAYKPEFLSALNTSGVGDYLAALNGDWPEDAAPIMPDKVDTILEQFAQRGRPVDSHQLGGILHRPRAVPRTSSETKMVQAAQYRLTDLARELKSITGGTFLGSVTNAGLVSRIQAEVVEIIEAVPLGKYKLLKIPPVLKELPGI